MKVSGYRLFTVCSIWLGHSATSMIVKPNPLVPNPQSRRLGLTIKSKVSKEKSIEKFPRKLPTRKNFKCVKPKSLVDDFKEVVSGFVESLAKEGVRRAVRDRCQAQGKSVH